MPIDPITGIAIANAGTALIGGISELIGSGQNNRAAKRNRASYDKQMAAIPLEDPNIVGLLGDTRRRRRAFEAGTDPMTSYASERIMETGAQTQTNALRAGAMGVGDLMRVQAGTNQGIAGTAARAAQMGNNLFAMEGDLVRAISDRTYRRQMSDARLAWNEYAREREDANRRRQAGIGMLLGIGAEAAGGMGGDDMGGDTIAPKAAPQIGTSMAATIAPDYYGSSGYRSRANYGFNYMKPSLASTYGGLNY